MKERDSFATEVRRLRREAGKTLRDVAEVLDCSIPYVSDVEHGRRLPPASDKILEMAKLFGHPELYPKLKSLAIQARGGAIELQANNETTRELLVALERRIESDTLDDELIKKLRQILNGGKK